MTGGTFIVKNGNNVSMGKVSHDGYFLDDMIYRMEFLNDVLKNKEQTTEDAAIKIYEIFCKEFYKEYDPSPDCISEDATCFKDLVHTTTTDLTDPNDIFNEVDANNDNELNDYLACSYADCVLFVDIGNHMTFHLGEI